MINELWKIAAGVYSTKYSNIVWVRTRTWYHLHAAKLMEYSLRGDEKTKCWVAVRIDIERLNWGRRWRWMHSQRSTWLAHASIHPYTRCPFFWATLQSSNRTNIVGGLKKMYIKFRVMECRWGRYVCTYAPTDNIEYRLNWIAFV